MATKKNYGQEILIISVLTLTITLLWIYFGIRGALTKKTQNPILTPQETKILVPKLDTSVFQELLKRKI